jgi:membrane-bound metal-dependent hydrolase YbcI (DUF457 family)
LQMILVAGLSMLPDLDVIPAMILGDMQRYHNNFSHSFVVAIPVVLLVAGVFHKVYRSNSWLWFVICSISYDLHIIMDALTGGRGVMVFWPLTETRFAAPAEIFRGLKWGEGWFSLWHLWTIVTETLFSFVVLFAIYYFDKRRNHKTTQISSSK